MPQTYPSWGEAAGAAMAHNIRLAHPHPRPTTAPAAGYTVPPADMTVERHPRHGVVVRSERDHPGGPWIFDRFGFTPVPDNPQLYRFAGASENAAEYATQLVRQLRLVGYTVGADRQFEPSLYRRVRSRLLTRAGLPDVAFADHYRLGFVAAVADSAQGAHAVLGDTGWRHDPHLDIHLLPTTGSYSDGLLRIKDAADALRLLGLNAAVQTGLIDSLPPRRRQTDPPQDVTPQAVPVREGSQRSTAASSRSSTTPEPACPAPDSVRADTHPGDAVLPARAPGAPPASPRNLPGLRHRP